MRKHMRSIGNVIVTGLWTILILSAAACGDGGPTDYRLTSGIYETKTTEADLEKDTCGIVDHLFSGQIELTVEDDRVNGLREAGPVVISGGKFSFTKDDEFDYNGGCTLLYHYLHECTIVGENSFDMRVTRDRTKLDEQMDCSFAIQILELQNLPCQEIWTIHCKKTG